MIPTRRNFSRRAAGFARGTPRPAHRASRRALLASRRTRRAPAAPYSGIKPVGLGEDPFTFAALTFPRMMMAPVLADLTTSAASRAIAQVISREVIASATARAAATSATGETPGVLVRIGRFFYDSRSFTAISREYWGGIAGGRSLHHWLIPQRWTWVPQGIRNAGFNLFELPSLRGVFHPNLSLNSWMGFATRWGGVHAIKAFVVENAIRVFIPGVITGGATAGWQVGEHLSNEGR